MMRSMTAYGRAVKETSIGRVAIELQTLNRKHLDINVSMPREWMRFEVRLRKWVSEKITRGQIQVRLSITNETKGAATLEPNLFLARQMQQAWSMIASDLGIELKPETIVSILSQQEELISYQERFEDDDALLTILDEVLHEALEQLLQMKGVEGAYLAREISGRLPVIKRHLEAIESLAAGTVEKSFEKIKERVLQVLGEDQELDERLLREAALYADRLDISEEVARFRSHLEQMDVLLQSDQVSKGKTVEFLLQELHREVNTMGSKAQDAQIASEVVAIKSEIEKIREQIQNVE